MNACSPYTLFIKPVDEFSVQYSTVPDIPEYRRVQYCRYIQYYTVLYSTVPVYTVLLYSDMDSGFLLLCNSTVRTVALVLLYCTVVLQYRS